MMKHTARGFTLVEILVVIVIVGIILSSVIFLGSAYIQTIQVKTEKQGFTGQYNTYAAIARTSNYLQIQEYEELTISIYEGSITATAALTVSGTASLNSYTLEDTYLSFSGSDSGGRIEVDIIPYQIGCDRIWVSSLGTTVTGVDLQMVSSINNDVYCFSIDESTCKLTEDRCS